VARARRPCAVRGGEGGLALLGAVLVLAMLAAVTAATLWLVRSELWVAGSARTLAQARSSAEAGVWHALSLIAPGTDFAALAAGTGGLADPSQPGPLTAAGGGFVEFPGPPFGYAVTVQTLDAERVRLRSTATSVRGARRIVDATIGRDGDPYTPAALVVTSGSITIAPGLSGLAPAAGGILVDASAPSGGAQAVIAAASADGATAAWSSLTASAATLVGATARARARRFDVAAFAAAAGLPEIHAEDLTAPRGTASGPVALRVAAGTAPMLQGYGVAFVTGDLDVDGVLDWRGALYVAGRLHVRGSSCRVDGMLWASALQLTTGCALRFDRSALATADAALRLPRRPTLLALDDA
jgi:hypothetical protein